ncbi:MAG: molybdenum cofactor guanylyltransferase [Deltaproteobacteria bacterium]|nr:molybdenum cofactor guanylyltransferase [Deltaproteobacteria bacterium]
MGTDKSRLPVGEKSLIEHVLTQLNPYFEEILISSGDTKRFASLGVKTVPDRIPGKGPVMGLMSAIQASSNNVTFVQACDIPQTDFALIKKMLTSCKSHDAVVPRDPRGHIEPLFAVYKKDALQAMKHVFENENGRASRIVAHCNARFIDLDSEGQLRNLNTMEDYRIFLNKCT